MATNIAFLSASVLEEILRFEGLSHHIIELWKCGNTLLNTKLASGINSIRLVAVRDINDLNLPIPSILGSFRYLKHLHLASSCKDLYQTRQMLQSIPSTHLEHLHIATEFVFELFLNCAPGSTATEPQYVVSNYGRGNTRYIDMTARFPKLYTLKMIEENGCVPPLENVLDLAGLPSSLTWFGAESIPILNADVSIASILPKSLMRLDAAIVIPRDGGLAFKADWERYLPHTYIRKIIECYTSIPKSFEKCWPSNFDSFTPKLARTLPSLLSTLSVEKIPQTAFDTGDNWATHLPSGLESLSIEHNSFHFEPQNLADSRLLIDQLPLLPSTLTEWSTGFCTFGWREPENEVIAKVMKWPLSLTSYKTYDFPSIERLKLLPRHLKSANIELENPGTPTNLILDGQTIPPNLTEFILLFYTGYSGDCSLSISSDLPASLTKLSLVSRDSDSSGLTFESFKFLHKLTALQSLGVTFMYSDYDLPLDSIQAPLLPPNLTILDVDRWNVKWFGSLPRSLIKFETHSAHANQIESDEEMRRCFLQLPPNIVSITIFNFHQLPCIQAESYEANDFAHLPRLRHLAIESISNIEMMSMED